MNPTATTLTVHTDAGPLALPAGATLADAVHALWPAPDADTRSVATAVNGCFVPREARATHLLHEGDHVLCFSPITGG
ncbi:thiamine biosynthesis protein ThiS [Aquabacterium fontiphilum]|jgi:sulfur carrier protein|uniref:sulfur carrier protein ThiS n=1 Tax=Aquabacterium fontiphilum TaxID=450365 RepID=UPI0013774BE8|nr:MoaD/ThiS family protein [Aquabacterium fontiphilum]NBD20864.1 thiamine biosynthesis protein ThiS [Aquabacterium fontiphilum]